MLVVPTRKLGDPMLFVILVKADDGLLHQEVEPGFAPGNHSTW